MSLKEMERYRPHLIFLTLTLLMIIGFGLRVLPFLVTRDQPFFPVFDTDSWYNLRQIEVMVHHFPQYNWFDPMTAYPSGKMIDWGPLFPALGAALCLIAGATTRDAIISVSGFMVPFLAALLIPVLFLIGRDVRNTATGLVAAALGTVAVFPFFTLSSYGMVDHHIAEVFFTSLFFLVYLYALTSAKESPSIRTDKKALLRLIILASLAGLVFFFALISSTTVLLALLVVAVFTFICGIGDHLEGKPSDRLGILNLAFLAVTSFLLVLFGFNQEGISFFRYSMGLVYVLLAVMAGTLLIIALQKLFRDRRTYLISMAVLVAGAIGLTRIVPLFSTISQNAFDLLFGSSVFTVGVQETLPWSLSSAFDAINVGLVLVAGGFLVLGYRIFRTRDRDLVFLGVWSVLMLIITIRHQRFLSYFAVNVMLLAALCFTEPLGWNEVRLLEHLPHLLSRKNAPAPGDEREKGPAPAKSGKKKQPARQAGPESPTGTHLQTAVAIAVLILTMVFVGVSVSQDFQFAVSAKEREIPADWTDSLQWLSSHTPDPGVDYFGYYDSKTFSYPPASYGIMAVWDAGHWVTFFSHRLPITNPFQDNLAGESGAAAYFLSDNESRANAILAHDNGRFVMTDSGMAVDRFTNLVPWVSGSVDISPYITWFLVPDSANPMHLNTVHKFDDGYFQTLIVKLQSFDGSMTEPTTAEYLRYTIRQPTALETATATGYSRVVTSDQNVTVSEMNTSMPLNPEGPELLPQSYADLYSGSPVNPVRKVPALVHYRLVHESAHNASVTPFPESTPLVVPGMKVVKVFEFVRGAHIAGEGMIELPLVTNTGRTFTYRQESSGGEFIVPYSTTGNPYDVRATGPYHIVGTTRTFSVAEVDVLDGKQVGG
jgi:oligosaccharyl transferase (archaeosortase A-associated)